VFPTLQKACVGAMDFGTARELGSRLVHQSFQAFGEISPMLQAAKVSTPAATIALPLRGVLYLGLKLGLICEQASSVVAR
jgi:hypothetical protein